MANKANLSAISNNDLIKTLSHTNPVLGYFMPEKTWEYQRISAEKNANIKEESSIKGSIKLENGSLTPEEIKSIIEVIPGEMSFVDKNNKVKFFSKGDERIFTRTKTVIGREVSNCHPPASVHMVEKVVDDFKSGKKNNEDFWIQMGDKFILIRFFAVRDENGEYMGTLEYVQNVGPIRNLQGEKRLIEG